MWGSVLTEVNTLTNFNYGFSTHKSDILIHLSQWQYWWWFWFSLFWVVYFFLIIRVLNRRTLNYNPMLNTSLRSHGKWGDFLVALIPLSWCGNILVNSNFILRMIEWQNESSLFTIRVQGKQWYWVYKFDANAAQAIFSAPKNIGHNNWFISTPYESYLADTYYQTLQTGTQLEYRKLYLKYLNEEGRSKKVFEQNKLSGNEEFFSLINKQNPKKLKELEELRFKNRYIRCLKKKKLLFNKYMYSIYNIENIKNMQDVYTKKDNLVSFLKKFLKNYKYTSTNNFYDFDVLDDLYNYAANSAIETKIKSLSFNRGILNKHNFDLLLNYNTKIINFSTKLTKLEFFLQHILDSQNFKTFSKNWLNYIKNYSFNKPKLIKLLDKITVTKPLESLIYLNISFNNNFNVTNKVENNELLWGFRQKKYKRFKKFYFNDLLEYTPNSPKPKLLKREVWQLKNNIVVDLPVNPLTQLDYHNALKFNRHRAEIVPVNLARRLLRVKRTLVLPAHVNITLISNSYDVVHSWFIPGLGLKIDCVPGRSTHHTFYIDNIGFYYGQCAEICGRYHHHMPIRLCALSFDHFLIWWQKKGLKRLQRLVLLKVKNSGINYLTQNSY